MTDKRKKLTDAELDARMRENIRRTRELAWRAYAKLTPAEQARVRELVPSLRDR